MFSHRLPVRTDLNAISRALAALRAEDAPIVDLTESNPTRVGLLYPADALAALADTRACRYEPDPLGLRRARTAIAADAARRGVTLDPDRLVLSASTSESYSWLFKLLCDPGDHVLVPHPSYPLFAHLTALDGVRVAPYRLEYHGRWDVAMDTLAAAPPTTRALLVVSPNNPTGSMISAAELDALVAICARHHWALIADEVFADYVLEATAPVTDLATRAGVLAFTLGGASKSLGLPQVKLGWIVVGGPDAQCARAMEALALIADTYLSVSTPVQVAAPALLHDGAPIREAIHDRLRRNLAHARRAVTAVPACDLLRVEGGWSVVVRVPATRSEDTFVLELLQRERVLVHPGYFFDFAHEAYMVLSLIVPETTFAKGLDRLLPFAVT